MKDKNPFILPPYILFVSYFFMKDINMLYRQKHNTYIRRYADAGYIMNDSISDNRVFDSSGAIFLQALSREPQSLTRLGDKISASFIEVDRTMLEQDVVEFYAMLESDGFIVSGETLEYLDRKDVRFSYRLFASGDIETDAIPVIQRAEKSTDEFLQEHFKKHPQPTRLHIELTSRCNERCVHCYIPHENKLHNLDDVIFYNLLDQCQEMGLLSLTLSGGEPMCHPHFLYFLRKAKEYDFSIDILSNLTLLSDEIIDEIKADRVSMIQVSLYSMNPKIHDSITQLPGSFYKTRDAILRLIDADVPLQIACPILKQNKADYVDVQNWGQEHYVNVLNNYIMIGRYNNTTDNLDNRISLDESGRVMFNSLLRNSKTYQKEEKKYEIMANDKRDISDDGVCSAGISSITVGANGNVYPCTGWDGFICGSLKKQPLREIWDKSPQLNYLRGLRWRDFPKCVHCADKAFCAFCIMRNANGNRDTSAIGTIGDPLKIDDFTCKNATLTRKIVMEWKNKAQG
jgi:radical SAM protein with 4Fe4S-binding SPASM domain